MASGETERQLSKRDMVIQFGGSSTNIRRDMA